MPVKPYQPNDAGRRIASRDVKSDVTKERPEKSLTASRVRPSGRNAQGIVTVRHRGGGAKRLIRLVDFVQDRYDVPAKVIAIEYDPNRGPRLALLEYPDAERRYILAPEGLRVGDVVVSSLRKTEIKVGNRMPLALLPVGMMVHNVELRPGGGGKMGRGAGLGVQLLAVEGDYAHLRLPSGEMRMVSSAARASIGIMGNPDHRLVRLGKAGRTRHRGRRPEVRGKAMNPIDHPHGGGEGKHPIGMAGPKTPWGKPALGVKTRRHDKWSDKFIVARRK